MDIAITATDTENFYLYCYLDPYVCMWNVYEYWEMLTICFSQMKLCKSLDLVIHEEPSFSWEIEFSATF